MSLALDSMVVEDQGSTPTPGSPHPFIPVENHDRLNSIQLSSDASGELSSAHSPRAFLGPPGEALSELRNACNPPWLHGLTGTPPGIVGLHRADRAGRWVEDARRHAEQQPIDLDASLACLSLGHGVLTARDISRASPLLRGANPLDAASKAGKLRSSPFDKAPHATKRADRHDHRNSNIHHHELNPPSTMNPHDGQSGDGSSGDEEAWPIPETPFLSNDVWSEHPNRKELSKSGQLVGVEPKPHDIHKSAGVHRKHVNDPTTGRGLHSKNSAQEGERRIGRCKMYNCDKGVGFLIDDRLDQVPHDVKIHWTDIYSDQEFKSLAKGEIVEYTLNITVNGFSASYVTGPGGRPVMGAEQAIVQASRQTSYKLFKAGALPVKTYRSKWEAVMPEASPVQPTVARPARSTAPTQAVANATESKPITSFAPSTAGFASKNQKTSTAPLGGVTRNESATQNQEHYRFNGANRLGGNISPNVQFNSPGWAALQSPVNYMHSPNSLVNGFAGSQTPLPGLSHSVTTPSSAESFNLLFPSGYTPHHPASVRFPSLAIATPPDNSHAFLASHLLNPSQRSMNPTDLQSFLAERQMLLQQQALLMTMCSNQSPATLQALNQLPGLNRLNQSHSIFPAENQNVLGVYNKESLTLDPKLQYFGLLPPISIPASQQQAAKPSDVLRKRAAGPWRAPGAVELNIDSSGGLRANAVTFTPAGANNNVAPNSESQKKNSQVEDISRNDGSPVYQIPGRRSVSDPAAAGLFGAKKTSYTAQLQSRNQNALGSTSIHGHPSRFIGDKTLNAKRVTFAEHVHPARRVVSHGEVPGTPIAEEDARGSEIGSLESSCESTYINDRKYSIEEIRRIEDVKSVDIAMERLRLAAAPQRLSLKDSVLVSQAHKEMHPSSQTLVE